MLLQQNRCPVAVCCYTADCYFKLQPAMRLPSNSGQTKRRLKPFQKISAKRNDWSTIRQPPFCNFLLQICSSNPNRYVTKKRTENQQPNWHKSWASVPQTQVKFFTLWTQDKLLTARRHYRASIETVGGQNKRSEFFFIYTWRTGIQSWQNRHQSKDRLQHKQMQARITGKTEK